MSNHTILPAVAMIVFNERGEILLQKRRDSEQWCILSGHVEFGETLEQAALREIWEETGCHASVQRLIGIYSEPESQIYFTKNGLTQYITTCLELRLEHNGYSIQKNEESLDMKFFAPDSLPQPLAQMHPEWLRDSLNHSQEPVLR